MIWSYADLQHIFLRIKKRNPAGIGPIGQLNLGVPIENWRISAAGGINRAPELQLRRPLNTGERSAAQRGNQDTRVNAAVTYPERSITRLLIQFHDLLSELRFINMVEVCRQRIEHCRSRNQDRAQNGA